MLNEYHENLLHLPTHNGVIKSDIDSEFYDNKLLLEIYRSL